MFFRFGGSTWEVTIDPQRLQDKIDNNFAETKTRRSSNKRQQEAKESPRGHRPKCNQRFGVDFEAQKEARDSFKSIKKEAKMAPKRSQDHLRLQHVDVENM